jgi:hypothetical protein
VLKLASRNTLLASFRADDEMVWSLLTNRTNKIGNAATNAARQHPDGQPCPKCSEHPLATTWSPPDVHPAKSVLNESKQIERAAMLIEMGARMQVLESETAVL